MKFDLIQRGIIKTNKRSEIQGLDSLIRYDYMGSAEFEYGTLPKALNRLLVKLHRLNIVAIDDIRHPKDNARLFIVSEKHNENEIGEFLLEQANGTSKIRLKEPTQLDDVLAGTKWHGDINFWWDIENDWMACFGKENAENVLVALKLVAEKRKEKKPTTVEEQAEELFKNNNLVR